MEDANKIVQIAMVHLSVRVTEDICFKMTTKRALVCIITEIRLHYRIEQIDADYVIVYHNTKLAHISNIKCLTQMTGIKQ